jgi:F0F1-type ATP synthase assembly protein I
MIARLFQTNPFGKYLVVAIIAGIIMGILETRENSTKKIRDEKEEHF